MPLRKVLCNPQLKTILLLLAGSQCPPEALTAGRLFAGPFVQFGDLGRGARNST